MILRPPHGRTPASAFLKWCWARLTGAERLIVGGPGVEVGVNEKGQYTLKATGTAGRPGATIRMLLCDADTRQASYYLVQATLDPDQTDHG